MANKKKRTRERPHTAAARQQAARGETISPLAQVALYAALGGAALIIVAGSVWLITKTFKSVWVLLPLILGGALLLFAAVIHHRRLWTALSSRSAQHGYLTTFTILFALVMVVCVNLVSYRYHKRWDLTEQNLFSLSEQTMKILKGLKKDVKIISFAQPRDEKSHYMLELLEEFDKHSDKIKFDYVDADLAWELAEKYDVTGATIVFECGDNVEKVSAYDADEGSYASALLKVTRDTKKKIYFLTGHGEKSLQDSDPRTGLSYFKQMLEHENYEAATLNLADVEKVPDPEECFALVIAGPTVPLPEEHVKAVKDYLNQGGRLLAMVDPPSQNGVDLNAITSEWGIETPNEEVFDNRITYQRDPGIPGATAGLQQYTSHELTSNGNLPDTWYPHARPVIKTTATKPDVQITELVKTSSNSYAHESQPKGFILQETSPAQKAETASGESKAPAKAGQAPPAETPAEKYPPPKDSDDRTGPFPVVVIATNEKPSTPPPPEYPGAPPPPPEEKDKTKRYTQLVVIGDSDLATNQHFVARSFFGLAPTGNANLLMNCVAWLAQEPELIGVRAKEPKDHTVALNDEQKRKMTLSTLILTPLLIIVVGVVVWWKRR